MAWAFSGPTFGFTVFSHLELLAVVTPASGTSRSTRLEILCDGLIASSANCSGVLLEDSAIGKDVLPVRRKCLAALLKIKHVCLPLRQRLARTDKTRQTCPDRLILTVTLCLVKFRRGPTRRSQKCLVFLTPKSGAAVSIKIASGSRLA